MKKKLNKIAKDTNTFLKNFIKKQGNSKLAPAMKYGLFPGGKKIRSKILIDIGSLLSVNYKKMIIIGAAVECIHAYSLIHDDLPCMDDDVVRRGKPSTHVKFGESTAVLAGNSLQTMACEILANPVLTIKEKTKVSLIKKLSECSGHLGIAGGQYLDLNYEKKKVSKSKIIEMEKKKTGKLFSFCCLIDFKGDSKKAGKKTGKDKQKGKATLISLLGYNNAVKYCKNIIIEIEKNLKRYGKNSKNITETLNYILIRDK